MGTPIVGKIQIGKESAAAHGTAVAATKILPIVQKQIPVDRKVTQIPYDIGVNVDNTGDMVQGRLVEDTLSWDHGFFQLLPYLLSGAVKGGVVATEKTVGKGDWQWTFTPSLTGTDNAQDSFTLQRGDNVQAIIHAYTMFKSIKISGQVNQAGGENSVKIDADYFARENVAGTFTAALAPMTMDFMNAKLARLYLDTAWAGVDTTELAGLLKSFEIQIVSGLYPDFSGSQQETFDVHGQGPMGVMLTLTLKRCATTEALRLAIGSFRAAHLEINGPIIGTSTTNQQLVFEMGGIIGDVVPMAQNDRSKGANLDTLVLTGVYDPTAAQLFTAKVITTIGTL